jgi:diguanylate cyclase (GGDEF)-like protein
MKQVLEKNLFKNIIMMSIYFVMGKISFLAFSQDMIVTMAAFMPEGFALAGVLIYGKSILPGIFVGQFILGISSGMSPLAISAISAINTTEAYIAFWAFNAYKLNKELRYTRDIFGLLFLILFILQPFSAFLGNGVLLALGNIEISSYLENVFFWWFGNVMGQLLFTPMLLVLYYNKQQINLRYFFYVLLFFLSLNYILQVTLNVQNVTILLMLTLPTTIYLATTNLSYASVASVSLACISLYFTHLGIGTFTKENTQIDNIIDLNFFMVSHIILVLIIGTLFREKEEAIELLKSMAHYDALTGLPNRRILKDEIHHAIYRAESNSEQSAICFIDIDNFKGINDTYGHSVGDEVLKAVVNVVKPQLNTQDAFLRLGGDEFLIVANNILSQDLFQSRLEKIRTSVKHISIGKLELTVTLSIGVALCPDNGTNIETLMDNSDHAMYITKQNGKNGFTFA